MRQSGVKVIVLVSAAIILAGCVTPPMGPQVSVMPGPNKSFEAFQQDQYACEDFASSQVAGGAERANNRAVATTAVATGIGAAVGAATGGGRSTSTGLALGALVGTAMGANQSARVQYGLQRRYDMAFAQCMTSKGNRVEDYRAPYSYPPPPPNGYPPPPPPGY